MSDQKTSKKAHGRGRGRGSTRPEGPWARSKKLDETHDIRPPKKDGEEFVLTESSFPPLPGAAANTLIDDQFDDNIEGAGTSQINGRLTNGVDTAGENKIVEASLNKFPAEQNCYEKKEKGQVEQEQSTQEVKNSKDDSSQISRPKEIKKGNEEPQQNGNSQTSTDSVDNHYTQVDIANSNLSPFAVEFIPHALNMNPEAQDFIPTMVNGNHEETNNNRAVTQSASASNINVNDTAAILADLEETVNFCYSKLNETPASYDELIGVVTPHFMKYVENPELPSEIVQILYNYAIQDTRFSYFAVKILIHLINMTSGDGHTELRDMLLRHIEAEVKQTQTVRLMDPNVNCTISIQPILTFLSELYIQLDVGGKRFPLMGKALAETLEKLLDTVHIPIKERCKLVVNMVKLTGLSLDQDNPCLLDGIYSKLRKLLEQECSNLDNPTVQIVNDIILLRTLSWGYVEPEFVDDDGDVATSPSGAFAHTNGYETTFDSNMVYAGVFYGPDGHPIGHEEQLFLEVETDALNHLQLADQGEPSPTSVEGFDEAYEEFLKTIPGHTSD